MTLPDGDDGQTRMLGYVAKDQIVWEDGEKEELEKFRTSQLQMRVREVYETYYAFQSLLANGAAGVDTGMDEAATATWLDSFKAKVSFDRVDLTGHSFGGGTMVSRAKQHTQCHMLIPVTTCQYPFTRYQSPLSSRPQSHSFRPMARASSCAHSI